jgi:hypothetical protein
MLWMPLGADVGRVLRKPAGGFGLEEMATIGEGFRTTERPGTGFLRARKRARGPLNGLGFEGPVAARPRRVADHGDGRVPTTGAPATGIGSEAL